MESFEPSSPTSNPLLHLHLTQKFPSNLVNWLVHRLWHVLLSTIGTFSSFPIRRHSHHRFLPYQCRCLHPFVLTKTKVYLFFQCLIADTKAFKFIIHVDVACEWFGRSVSGPTVTGTNGHGGGLDSVVSATTGT